MIGVRVAIPLYRGKRRFHLEKGRRWSVLEHLVLAALAEAPRTAEALAAAGQMHQRLAIEILVRLMRAGWAELRGTTGDLQFTATAAGISAAKASELPVVARPLARWMNFVVDRVSGTVFKPREMPFLHVNAVRDRAQREPIVWLEPSDVTATFEVQDLIEHLFRDDEQFVAMEPGGDRLMERWGLVLVRGDKIEGLPERAPKRLSDAILQAAKSAPQAAPGRSVSVELPQADDRFWKAPPAHNIVFAPDDLVVGGQAHEDALFQIIGQARLRLIIQSTFVSLKAFERLRPRLLDAARRGARIDLLWGEGDDPRSTGKTRKLVVQLRDTLAQAGEDELIRLHPFSTRSHAKFVIADRAGGAPTALLGSCNWLSTDMSLVEASVRLRDPRLVSDLLFQAAELSRGRDGHWNELTSELASYAKWSATAQARNGPVKARLLLATDHKPLVVQAAAGCNQLFVSSHRVSVAARQAVLHPVLAALAARPFAAEIRFGREADPGEPDWNAIASGLDLKNIAVDGPREPAIHAKLLAWDDDDVVVTSQNWLSADPADTSPRREIGVHLSGPGVARALSEALAIASVLPENRA
jgi:cardiolipin synthase